MTVSRAENIGVLPARGLIARCACGGVEYQASGRPIVSLVCFCRDCQAGSERLEALPGASPVRDPDGGTAYVSYRKDRIECSRGADLLKTYKLREGAATSRVAASCCGSAMVMRFDDARHWVAIYRGRIVGAAPEAEMRVCMRSAPSGAGSSGVPGFPGFPGKLLARLLMARIGMLSRD